MMLFYRSIINLFLSKSKKAWVGWLIDKEGDSSDRTGKRPGNITQVKVSMRWCVQCLSQGLVAGPCFSHQLLQTCITTVITICV